MKLIKNNLKSVTAFAPATCANVAVGYDILGFAIEGVGDKVTVSKRSDRVISVEVQQKKKCIPTDPTRNCASVPMMRMLSDYEYDGGFNIDIKKGIPMSSGMGGSAASAVAGLVACNAFFEEPLSVNELIQYAMLGEEIASGVRHADNIIPCFYGGFCLMQSYDPIHVVSLPTAGLFAVLVHPHMQIETRKAREILSNKIALQQHVVQSANLAGFMAGIFQRDYELVRHSLQDQLIEPQRAKLLPGFYKVKEAALQAGALGASFSGSGPTMFAFSTSEHGATVIGEAMQKEFKQLEFATEMWVTPLNASGATVLESLEDSI